MMRRALLSLAFALACTWALPIHAGSIVGKVVHSSGERDVSGLTVKLFAADSKGGFSTSETKTTKQGEFQFADLAPTRPYGVYVEYRDIMFPAEFVEFKPEQPDETRSVELTIQDPSEDDSKVQLFEARTVVDRGEAGSYRVQQIFYMTNLGETVVYAKDPAGSLFDIGLLPKHEGVEAIQATANQLSPARLEVEGDRARYRGPVFPGIQTLEVVYEVDAGGPDLASQLEFLTQTPQFVLMVPDRRQAVYAQGLYPSMQSGQREPAGYQYFRGYDIAPGTRVDLRIEAIPEPAASAVVAAATIGLLLFGLCVFVGMPIANDLRGTAPSSAPDKPLSASDLLVASLRDLEHDYEMGKISEADRDQLRRELQREAVIEMARQREAEAKSLSPAKLKAAGTEVGAFCPSCGGATSHDDRFCRSCGTKL